MFLSFPIKFVISRYVARIIEQNKLLKCVFIWSFHKNLKPYLLICNKKNFLSQTFTQTCITFWTRPKEMCIKVKFWIWNQALCSYFVWWHLSQIALSKQNEWQTIILRAQNLRQKNPKQAMQWSGGQLTSN